ncbi:multicopper oxidase family protein [Streptomyces ipomoeae]|uniref:Multicopper oxidase CueO n=1 Tax=Streptomyces ipomoeae 91-03 TaxID=698759 RepID=L1KKE8_9ACTN|nr:multicopper oxidase domain-containing protein [Streptomyces ipomoeae]EKX60955.1 Tat pathway signal sequence domain protein [Streptomyces ipomoeae 91-03]MDX2700929.1 multicopper oxidase domain-containing protein [Streptomyces ipomoeae]MDX2846550.1 multicopper oxidase domain-containing protein [Streptomyces ipomoeae]
MTFNTEPASGADSHGESNHNRGRHAGPDHSKGGRGKAGRGMHRRKFLGGMAGAGFAAVAAGGAAFSLLSEARENKAGAATNSATLTIPELLEGTASDGTTTFTLEARTGTAEILSGVTSTTAGYNQSFLGPTMKWTTGDTVLMNITNSLGEDTTVHFHGAHVPAEMDGGPQNAFADGKTWSPAFEVLDEAKTLWYHPHALGTTAEQVVHGLAGMIIVEDDSEASGALPSEYGVDDIPIILQCLAADSAGDVKYNLTGYLSNGLSFPLLCNGTNVDDTTLTFTATRTRTRFRVLNASPSDIITIQRGDGGTLTQIATDQGYLTSATEVETIRLVAGARAEFVMDLGDAVTLQAVVTTGWVRGGSGTYDFLTVTPDATDTPDDLPSTLNTIARYDTSGFTERTITLDQDGLEMAINGSVGTTMDSMATIMTTLGAEEIWTITNNTMLEHSFHLHDVPFQLIEINGEEPTGVDLGWFDTYEVVGGGSLKIAMKFTDFADDTYMYMLHCHLLQHEDEGMMAGLMVMES